MRREMKRAAKLIALEYGHSYHDAFDLSEVLAGYGFEFSDDEFNVIYREVFVQLERVRKLFRLESDS